MRALAYIKSHFFDEDGTEETVSSECQAEYAEEADGYTLEFDTPTEGGICRERYYFSRSLAEIRRTGAIESELIFSVGRRHMSLYRVGDMSFDTEVYTSALEVSLLGEGGDVRIDYEMIIGGLCRSSKMEIRIKAQ